MVANLNAAAFVSKTQNDYAKKNLAEAYMQIYQYAAEDFTAHPDIKRYIEDVTKWMTSVDERLTEQMRIIANHTHNIPPHMHGVIGHSQTTPVSLVTLVPVQSKTIRWAAINYPIYVNTTLTTPNLTGNKIQTSVASEGSSVPTVRRTLPIPVTLIPKLSPTLQDSLTEVLGG